MNCSGIYDNRFYNINYNPEFIRSYNLCDRTPVVYGISGIYPSENTNKYKIYVGSTNDFKERINTHFLELDKKEHFNDKIQNYYNKYGEQSLVVFKLEDLDLNSSIEFIRGREQNWIDFYKSNNELELFNIAPMVNNSNISEETRKKISKANKDMGKFKGEKNPMFGKHRYKELNPFYNKHHSENTKKILSEKAKLRSGTWIGKNHTKESKEKMRQYRLGKKLSKEAIDKMVETQKLNRHKYKYNTIPVKQIDINSNLVIKIWKSAGEAGLNLNIDRGSIGKCCKKKIVTMSGKYRSKVMSAGNFKWEYATKDEYKNFVPWEIKIIFNNPYLL